jgi:hypothetical protein
VIPQPVAPTAEAEPPAPMPPRGYTPPPAGAPLGEPVNKPEKLDHHDKMKIRAAAFQAKRQYPGPVGELICKELLDWEDFGFRFGNRGGLIGRLVAEVTRPAPTDFDI